MTSVLDFVSVMDGMCACPPYLDFEMAIYNILVDVSCVAVSPDATNVYASAGGEDTLLVYERDPASGNLTLLEIHRDGADGVSGLSSTQFVVVSGDGKNVYATGAQTLAVFSREPSTGRLTFLEVQTDGVGGVDGISGANGLALSPDGDFVYATGEYDDAVAVFQRDPSTGALIIWQVLRDGVGGVEGLDGASCVAVSPDGLNVYATGWNDDALVVFSRDLGTGDLSYVQTVVDDQGGVAGLGWASSVAVSPDGNDVYATGPMDSAVAVFERSLATGELTFTQVLVDGQAGVEGLSWAQWVALSPDGQAVLVAGQYDNAVAVFDRNATSGELGFLQVVQDGVGLVEGLSGPTSVTVTPDGNHVIAAGHGEDAICVLSRDIPSGLLSYVTHEAEEDFRLRHASSVSVSADGWHVYATAEIDSSIVVFDRDADTGDLSFVEALRDGQGGVEGLSSAVGVTASPDGASVYTVGHSDDAVTVFRRDPGSGRLTYVEVKVDEYGGVNGLDGASAVTLSPDGMQVYATGENDDAVVVFDRNPVTSRLTFSQVCLDTDPGIDGLDGASGVVVSPDGRHVYTTGYSDSALAVFARDPVSGQLTFLEVHLDDQAGVDGLRGASAVDLSSDGAQVYVAACLDYSVAVFDRDAATGHLVFVHCLRDGIGGVSGLTGACSMRVSPDGTRVYSAAQYDDAIAVFGRDPNSGRLHFLEVQEDGAGANDGLRGVKSVALSPDGAHVYGAGSTDDAVSVFTVVE